MRQRLTVAIQAAIAAGKTILEVYESPVAIEYKEDQSPLTIADKQANEVIETFLIPHQIPIISEETKQLPFSERNFWDTCWMVDPLDGTKEFIKRNGEFTVNIALIENGTPILGVVFVPVTSVLYFAAAEMGSFKSVIKDLSDISDWEEIVSNGTPLPDGNLPNRYTIVASRSHQSPETEKFIDAAKNKYGTIDLVSMGSSLKLCLVAEGKAHAYPRLAPTMEWDTAAAHAIAKYAGCEVTDFHTGKPLTYNKENLLNPFFLVSRE